jgi:ABC-type antimicrobial peptide transport system permease subunit
MRFRRTLVTAFRALSRNVTRAALTALGIVIGVAAVIAMMELGGGSSDAIQQSIKSMGANNLLVMPGTAASGGVSFGAGSVLTLTPEDTEAILHDVSSIKNAAPVVRARSQVVYGNRNWVPLNIYGTTPAFLDVRDWNELAAGEMFSERDVRNGNKVCVIGQTLARELFQGEPPVNKELRVQNVTLKVVGVLSRKGANMMGMDQDDILIAPWTTIKYRVTGVSTGSAAQSSSSSGTSSAAASSSSTSDVNSLANLYPNSQVVYYPQASTVQSADTPLPVRFTNVDQIMVAAASKDSIEDAINEITALLRDRHRIHSGEPDDFSIRDMAEITRALSSATGTMTRLLLAVALISLVVGGVGIMNIMLVSVTERTREIGLRMAVGARARDILQQFLVEAVALCASGGIIGILLGRGCSYLFTLVLKWPTKPSFAAIIASFVVSAGVGIIFGYYPAWKASKLDPIEALRYE